MLAKLACLVVSAFFACSCTGCAIADTTCYTQIDNEHVREIEPDKGVIKPNGGMSYEYSLPAYGQDGKESTVTFGTERELADGRYIKLTSRLFQGVIGWEEVAFDELPQKVQDVYEDEAAKE